MSSFMIFGITAVARMAVARFAGKDLFSISLIEHSHKSALVVDTADVIPELSANQALSALTVNETSPKL